MGADEICTIVPDRLTSLLISRFLLDLRAANRATAHTSSTSEGSAESIVFQRMVGSLGASIDTEQVLFGEAPSSDDDVLSDEGFARASLQIEEAGTEDNV